MSNRTADLDLTGATEAFCARLSAEGRSPATISAYRRDLALVARVAGELTPGIVCRAVTAGLLDQVFSDGAVTESERGPRSAASLHRMKAAVRAFFAWAVEAGVVEDNPARSIRMHRLPRKLPVFLTTAEKKRLLKELKGRTDFSALRDRAMIAIGYDTLCRRSALVCLRLEDLTRLSDGGAKILVRRAKNDQFGDGRWGYLSAVALAHLEEWTAAAAIREGPILRAVIGGHLQAKGLISVAVSRRLKAAAQRAGIAAPTAAALSGHSMRVGAAQDLMTAGKSLLQIMSAGGWTSVNVVGRYVGDADWNVWAA